MMEINCNPFGQAHCGPRFNGQGKRTGIYAKTAHICYQGLSALSPHRDTPRSFRMLPPCSLDFGIVLVAFILDAGESMLGKVYESPEVTGTITKDVAGLLGLSEKTVVVGGAGDNAAGAVGTGVVATGRAMTTIGTSGTVFAYADKPMMDEKARVYTFCMAVPDAWHFMGSVNSAGNSLKWYRNMFYSDDIEYEQINKDAMASAAGANNLIYMPYLTGEQSPHFDLQCRAGFVGLSATHTKGDLTRLLWKAYYVSRDVLTAVRESDRTPHYADVRPGAPKRFWRRLWQTSTICRLLPDMNSENAAARGAAILASVERDVIPMSQDACDKIIRCELENYNPNPAICGGKIRCTYAAF